MIPQFDKNAPFIWAVFLITIITLLVMVAAVFWRARVARIEADRLELEELDT